MRIIVGDYITLAMLTINEKNINFKEYVEDQD